MEVILLKDIKGLGQAGAVRKVADGYARNYLIPRHLAAPVSAGALKQVAERVAVHERQDDSEFKLAEVQRKKLDGVTFIFKVKVGEGGRLYGSVTSADIAGEISKLLGMQFDKRKVLLADPIKETGKSTVEVKLHSTVKVTVAVRVEDEGAS